MHSPASDATLNAELQVCSEKEWTVSCSKCYGVSIIVWGMADSLSKLEVRTKLVVYWVGRLHVRVTLLWRATILDCCYYLVIERALTRM